MSPPLPPLHAVDPVHVVLVQLYPLPIKIPAFGLSAVPLPMKYRKMPPEADAAALKLPAEPISDARGPSPLVIEPQAVRSRTACPTLDDSPRPTPTPRSPLRTGLGCHRSPATTRFRN